jgi:Domain of unknown function (DUF397)
LTQARIPARSDPPEWRTSSFCQNSECVEVAEREDAILIRSSRAPGDVIRLTIAEWRVFELGMRAGEFTDIGQ